MKKLIRKKMDIRAVIGMGISMFMAIILAFQLPVFAANTFPHQYELVSVNNTNGQGVDRLAKVEGVSSDGSKILFDSTATNLPNSGSTASVALDAGYMRNTVTGVTTRVDLSAGGAVPDRATGSHVMNSTGRYVAFVTNSSNIIDGTTLDSSVSRVYFKDLQTGAIDLIAALPYSVVNNYGSSVAPQTVSDDGRFVQILTNRVNTFLPGIRTGDGGGYTDILMYDRYNSSWTLIDKPASGSLQNLNAEVYSSRSPASCDESLIVFPSKATNLVANYSGSGKHIFVSDTRNGLNITDITPGATLDSDRPSISCNGRYIVYTTKDRSLVSPAPVGLDANSHLVRYDRFTGERKYIDSSSDGTSYNAYYSGYDTVPLSVSDNGDVVFPYSVNSNIYSFKVYFKHLSDGSGTLESVQHDYTGLSYDPQFTPTYMLSSDGKYVVVSSRSSTVLGIPGSKDSNGNDIPNIVRIRTGL